MAKALSRPEESKQDGDMGRGEVKGSGHCPLERQGLAHVRGSANQFLLKRSLEIRLSPKGASPGIRSDSIKAKLGSDKLRLGAQLCHSQKCVAHNFGPLQASISMG